MNEDLPENICESCIEKLTQVYKFKLECDNANNFFKNYLDLKRNEAQGIIKKKKEETYFLKDEDTFSDSNGSQIYNNDVDVSQSKFVNIGIKFKTCTSKQRFSCVICQKNFKTKKLLLSHKTIHEENLECTLGNEKSSEQVLQKHKKSKKHQQIDSKTDEISALSCKSCKKTFKSKYILLVHEKRHILKGNFLCTICGKGFNAKGCLNRHMRVHTGEKKYECSVCEKKFPSSNNLNLHFRIHSGEKPYLCTVCGKSFSHPTGLTYHVRTHTNERRYKCDFCTKSFAVQCHLDNHRKIHTGNVVF